MLSSKTRRHFSEHLREYFFCIDHKGLLFLEESEPKNFTNAVRDPRFLKHMYKHVKPNESGRWTEYPWLHECWGEYNFIKTAHWPVVFSHLEDSEPPQLVFNCDYRLPFHPENLRVGLD